MWRVKPSPFFLMLRHAKSQIPAVRFDRLIVGLLAHRDVERHHHGEAQHQADGRQVDVARMLGFGYQLFYDDEDHGAGRETQRVR